MASKRRFAARRSAADAGPGSPVYIMVQHVTGLLYRYRTVKPFPIPVAKFIETVYPKELFKPVTDRNVAVQWDNLLAATNMGTLPHFFVEGRDDTETFWVRLAADADLVPIPLDVSKPLIFCKENPHFKIINDWVTQALVIHNELNSCLEVCKRFIREAAHPYHIGRIWPELLSFVGEVPRSLSQHVDEIDDGAAVLFVPAPARAEVTTLLAKCVLLPEEICNAWVQFPEGA